MVAMASLAGAMELKRFLWQSQWFIIHVLGCVVLFDVLAMVTVSFDRLLHVWSCSDVRKSLNERIAGWLQVVLMAWFSAGC